MQTNVTKPGSLPVILPPNRIGTPSQISVSSFRTAWATDANIDPAGKPPREMKSDTAASFRLSAVPRSSKEYDVRISCWESKRATRITNTFIFYIYTCSRHKACLNETMQQLGHSSTLIDEAI